jgi:hypothetical protein
MTIAKLAVAVFSLAVLAGCGATGDHPENFYVAPGKYVLYDCKQLAGAQAHFAERDQELSRLIARAKEGAGGGVVSALAYEPEYYSNLGELRDVQREMREKNCPAEVKAAPVAPKPKRGR